MPSANAASLGEYGEIPVSYFTGVPDISIPLYMIKGNRISLPISLSYHAGGLRPDVHPGWVGNGWTLQAGGAITRKVNGMIDERSQSFCGTLGYYFNHADLAAASWSSTATLKTVGVAYNQVLPPANPSGIQNPQSGGIVDVDVEPDEFDFNFMGYSGKFFLDQNGNWQVQSNKAFKVVFNTSDFVKPFAATAANSSGDGIDGNDMVSTFGRFTIIDELGNKYVFGSVDANNSAIEFGDKMIPSSGLIGASITATSWYLTQISSADGSEVINLSYVRGPFTSYIGYEYAAQQYSISGNSQCSSSVADPGKGIFSGSVVAPVYLNSITMPSQNLSLSFANVSATNELNYLYLGSLANTYAKLYTDDSLSSSPAPSDFPSFYCYYTSPSLIPYYATNPVPPIGYNRFIWLELNSIRITNSESGAVIRNINFGYNNNPLKRLQLESVNITDANNNSIEANGQNYYSFGYNNQTALPNYLTIYGDHWGFNNYNGSNNLTYGYPSGANFLSLRSPDPTGVQTMAEILTSIIYPTGATTTFTYEPNVYSSWVDRTTTSPTPVASTGVGGGVRIKQISTTDQYNSTLVKNYYYVKGYTSTAVISSLTSSGVLDSKPAYNFITTGTTTVGSTFTNNYLASNSVVPGSSNTMGSYLGYTNVVEQRSDGSYTIYTYSNHDNGYADQSPVNTWNSGALRGYNIFNSLWFERGLQLDKKQFTNNDGVVLDESTTYTLTIPSEEVNAVNTNNTTVCEYGNVGAYERDAYYMIYSPFLPTTKTTVTYSSDGSGNSYAVTTNLTYDQYKNVTQSQVVNSKGQTETTTITYPPSLVTSDPNNPYNLMVNMNNVSSMVERRVSVLGNLTEGEVRTYQPYNSSMIYCTGIRKYENSLLVPVSGLAATAWSGAADALTFDPGYVLEEIINHDPAGNVSSVIHYSGNYPEAFLWDYNRELVVAKVENANNTYASSASSVQTDNLPIHVGLNLNTSETQNLVINTAGTVTLTFTYAPNPGIASTSQLTYTLEGPTVASGTLCAATPTSTTSCGSLIGTATINNVQPGNYTLVYNLISCTGFQNYYGYTLNIAFPTNAYTDPTAKMDIGYTSFEYVTASDLTYGTGNWTGINLSSITSGLAATGNYYYTLASGSPLTKTGLNTAQTYIVSYWSQNGPYTVTGSQSYITGSNIANGNWTYYEHVVANTASVAVSGSGGIDELRIYPKGSLMTTYAYTPLVGIISKCDENNYITSYQYDTFNRLMVIKDRDGNVLKEYQYNY